MGKVAAWPIILSVAVLAACGGDDSDELADNAADASTPISRLDCGQGKSGSERALRQFVAVLRGGDAEEIESVLAGSGRFEWISVSDRRGPDLSVRNDRSRAAAAVAERGGLPMEITRFLNSEPPGATTDFGFEGRWEGRRYLIGKAALDCKEGTARVFSIAVRPRPGGTDPSSRRPRDRAGLEVWFVDEGRLAPVSRVASTDLPARMAVEALLDGPTARQRERGISTVVPDGVRLLGLDVADGTATVDLTSNFEIKSGTYGESLVLAQLVYTLTQFESVDAVVLRLDGRAERFGGHGTDLRRPYTRRDFRDLVAPAAKQASARAAVAQVLACPGNSRSGQEAQCSTSRLGTGLAFWCPNRATSTVIPQLPRHGVPRAHRPDSAC